MSALSWQSPTVPILSFLPYLLKFVVNAHAVNDSVPGEEVISSGYVYGGVHERGVGSPTDHPPHGFSAVGIQNHVRVDACFTSGAFGDVRDPQVIRGRGGEA